MIVLSFLERNPDGFCIAELPLDVGYCGRNRVSELRRDGYDIRSERCRKHAHRGTIVRYRLFGQKAMAL